MTALRKNNIIRQLRNKTSIKIHQRIFKAGRLLFEKATFSNTESILMRKRSRNSLSQMKLCPTVNEKPKKGIRTLNNKYLTAFIGLCCGIFLGNFVQTKLDACEKPSYPQYIEEVNKNGKGYDDNFLFIGIMTARKYLESRALASSKTWVPRVPGQVVYFIGEGEKYTGKLNVVQLKGITENDYPPQKKSFAMMDYIGKHYSRNYQWIIRADDDVYIKVDDLVKFLKSIDNKDNKYIGQPGFGKSFEQGKLGLSGAFCMGGPSVIMTPSLVQELNPHLPDCLDYTSSGHEDTELGRCITTKLGVSCTSAFEMKTLFYQNYQELQEENSSFKKALGESEVAALTLHPVKEPAYVFRLDNFLNNRTLQKLEKKEKSLLAQIADMDVAVGPDNSNVVGSISRNLQMDSEPGGRDYQGRRKDLKREVIPLLPKGSNLYHDQQAWEMVRYRTLYTVGMETGKLTIGMQFKGRANLHDSMMRSVMTSSLLGNKMAADISSHFQNYTFQRLSPQKGLEGMVFLKKWVSDRKQIVPVYVRSPFNRHLVCFREDDEEEMLPTMHAPTIYVLMPLFQRSSIYKRFLEMYKVANKGYKGKVELRVVMFTDDRGEYKLMSAMTYSMLNAHPQLDIRIIYLDEPFNRGKGMMLAISDIPYSSLLLFMDVDMEFSSYFLDRVAKHTILEKTAYFPIYFVHFNPEAICYNSTNCDVLLNSRRDAVGIWRSFSYGVASVYKRDLVRAGGFKVDIKGWGLEDVDLYEKLIASGVDIMRTADPGIVHRYHPRECDSSLPKVQYKQCRDSGIAMLGSVKQLYHMLNDVSNGTET